MENIFTAARHFRNWFLQLSTSNGDCFSKPVGHEDRGFLFLLHFNLIYFKRVGALEEDWANIMFYNSGEWCHGVCGEGELHVQIYCTPDATNGAEWSLSSYKLYCFLHFY